MNQKIETILRLADLGFSRVEIEQLMAEKTAENAEKTAEKEGLIDLLATEKPEKTEEKAEKSPTEQPTPSVPTHEEGAKNPLEEKLAGIEATLKAIQAQNVRWSSMPDSAAKPKTELEIVQEILGGLNNGNE